MTKSSDKYEDIRRAFAAQVRADREFMRENETMLVKLRLVSKIFVGCHLIMKTSTTGKRQIHI